MVAVRLSFNYGVEHIPGDSFETDEDVLWIFDGDESIAVFAAGEWVSAWLNPYPRRDTARTATECCDAPVQTSGWIECDLSQPPSAFELLAKNPSEPDGVIDATGRIEARLAREPEVWSYSLRRCVRA